MTKLRELGIRENFIRDASPYTAITVPELDLSWNNISDFRSFGDKLGNGIDRLVADWQKLVIDGGKPEKTNVVTLPEVFAPDGTKIQLNAVDISERGANVVISGDTATITATGDENPEGLFQIAEAEYEIANVSLSFDVYVALFELDPAEPVEPAEP
ncbi:MAG: hypothetical protein Q4P06_08535, partial [Actinomycetaceae bacterium]|nr:hypothetical protein [Actinomycetaceae bacterium]